MSTLGEFSSRYTELDNGCVVTTRARGCDYATELMGLNGQLLGFETRDNLQAILVEHDKLVEYAEQKHGAGVHTEHTH